MQTPEVKAHIRCRSTCCNKGIVQELAEQLAPQLLARLHDGTGLLAQPVPASTKQP